MMARKVNRRIKTVNRLSNNLSVETLFSLFGLTRDIIKRNGRGCAEFTKLAIVVLNQIVRPFTAR